MSELEPRQPDIARNGQIQDSEGMPELNEETDPTFVTESSRPNRNTAMMVATLAFLGAAALYFMHTKAGPQIALAATPEVKAAEATIGGFLTDGGKSMRVMHDLLNNTQMIVDRFRNDTTQAMGPQDELPVNPFQFIKAKPAGSDEEDAARQRQKEKEREKQEIAKAVQQLQLQSVISGKMPTCMINNRACVEGQEVDGFVIESIRPNTVVVKRGGFRFELRMLR